MTERNKIVKKHYKEKEEKDQLNKNLKTSDKVELFFSDDIEFTNFLKSKNITDMSMLSASIIFEYFYHAKLENIYKIFDIFLDYKTNNIEKNNFKELSFSDYYVLIYLLERKYYQERINIDKEKAKEIIFNYDENININKLKTIYNLKTKTLKIVFGSEQQFIKNYYILKDYFDLIEDNDSFINNNTITLTNNHKMENLGQSTQVIKDINIENTTINETNTRTIKNNFDNKLNNQKKIYPFEFDKSNETIFSTFIKGEIFFGESHFDLISNMNYIAMILEQVNMNYSDDDITNVYKSYLLFYGLNNLNIRNFHNKIISENEFKKLCLSNFSSFIAKRNKKITSSKLYDFFTYHLLFFSENEKFIFNDFIKTLIVYIFPNNIKDINYSIIEEKLKDFWEIYYEYNMKILNESIPVSYKINKLLQNKNIVNEKIIVIKKLKKIYKKINTEYNDNLYIINLSFSKEFKNKLSFYNIKQFKDLKNLEFDFFKNIFDEEYCLNELEYIVDVFDQEIETKVYETLLNYTNVLLKETQKLIINDRSNNLTLETIGNNLGVTRERIRQIEAKSIAIYENNVQKNILDLLVLFSPDFFLTKEEIIKIFKEKAELVIYLNKDKYNNKIEILELTNLEKINEYILKEINDYDNTYVYLKELDDFINQIIDSSDFEISSNYIKRFILKQYEQIGDYIFFLKPTNITQYEIILKHHFDDFKSISLENINDFRDIFYDVFNDNDIYKKSDRAIIARIAASENVFLSDRGSYVYRPSNINIPEELLNEIYDFIISKKSIFTEALYNKFKKRLYPLVKNKYELHGIINYYFKDLYFTKDVVGTTINPTVNKNAILDNYILDNNGIIDFYKMIEDLPELAGSNFEYLITDYGKLIGMFNRKYIHTDYLKYDYYEMIKIKEFVENRLEISDFIDSDMLYNIMLKTSPSLVKENKINNTHYALNFFKNYFLNDFSYYSNLIAKLGKIIEKSTYEALIEKFITKDYFSINEIKNAIYDNLLRVGSIKNLLEEIYSHGYIRADDNVILKTDKIINEKAFNLIENIEKKMLFYLKSNKQINLNSIDYTIFPKINIDWNKHLVAHLLMNSSSKINVETIGSQYVSLEYILTLKGDNDDNE